MPEVLHQDLLYDDSPGVPRPAVVPAGSQQFPGSSPRGQLVALGFNLERGGNSASSGGVALIAAPMTASIAPVGTVLEQSVEPLQSRNPQVHQHQSHYLRGRHIPQVGEEAAVLQAVVGRPAAEQRRRRRRRLQSRSPQECTAGGVGDGKPLHNQEQQQSRKQPRSGGGGSCGCARSSPASHSHVKNGPNGTGGDEVMPLELQGRGSSSQGAPLMEASIRDWQPLQRVEHMPGCARCNFQPVRLLLPRVGQR